MELSVTTFLPVDGVDQGLAAQPRAAFHVYPPTGRPEFGEVEVS